MSASQVLNAPTY